MQQEGEVETAWEAVNRRGEVLRGSESEGEMSTPALQLAPTLAALVRDTVAETETIEVTMTIGGAGRCRSQRRKP